MPKFAKGNQHRWRKGQSGNPKGRPPKPSLVSELEKAVLEKVTTTDEKGRRKRTTILELLARKAVRQALSGEFAYFKVLIEYFDGKPAQLGGDEAAASDDWLREQITADLRAMEESLQS